MVELLGAIDPWIIGGVLVAALITTVLPADYFASQPWSQALWGLLVVLAIALPLYVCSTGSVPIAASLVAAGLPAGSALVFLMAGPATNVATFAAVYRILGARILVIYLGTVIAMSISFGLLFDGLLESPGLPGQGIHNHHQGSGWIGILSALILIGLLVFLSARRLHWRPRRRPRATCS